ncbi:quinone-interacting membrane-bound oxidoreductase complex subunit QmoC [Desulfovibrio sp. OttesenSCG-928-A18]|nr:quinone-interacting membrane-bound oxidoreductase complex subunit QmoC [Desulfovibrio sp. OttesenSCG-928-A18]
MAQPLRIEPDVQFIRELQAVGGDSLKKCYQCATCSVACPISPADNPYPRKEMIWAQWGLKDRLLSDADVWLCHNCGQCSDLCPRGAKPADLMSAMRNMAYQKLAPCPSIGKWMSSSKGLLILTAIPAVIFAVIWAIMAAIDFGGNFKGSIFPQGEVVPGKIFYGDYTIDPVFILVTIFVVSAFFTGVKNLIKSIGPVGSTMMLGKKKNLLVCLLEVITLEILPHAKFSQCGDNTEEKKFRKYGHMCLLFGFIALAVVTGCFFLGHWLGRIEAFRPIYMEVPLSFANPFKILAQLGMVLLLVGLTLLTVRRKNQDPAKQTSSWYDWYLLGVIWVVALTGMFTQFFRLADWAVLTYIIYYLHLVSVFMLLAYLPWSKLGHLVYRTAAITYIRYMGRK